MSKSFDELTEASQRHITQIMQALQASGERVGRSTVMSVIESIAKDMNSDS